MHNPFLLHGPTLISFSGGRTSAYMLWRILEAHGGGLPGDIIPCFANTGKEAPKTLDFVRECQTRWAVPMIWLEYDPAGAVQRRFRVVDHASASRHGEPYEALIRQRQYLPNPVTRFCTTMLKIRVLRDYARSLGWEHWTNAIGLRADEPRRVAKINNQRERWETVAPLAAAGVTLAEIEAFWNVQPFRLALPSAQGKTPLGNCDLCFLKSARTISAILADDPSLADWWIRMEDEARPAKPTGALFRKDRPNYRQMQARALSGRRLDFGELDRLEDCHCHD